MKEIRPLTALRFLAALIVFVHHYSGIPYGRVGDPLQSLAVEGHIGVTVFFVLSGFLITLHYAPAIAARKFSWGDYLLKRAARVLPLYFVVLALTMLLEGQALFTPQTLSLWTLTQSYFDLYKFSGISTAWTLSVEVTFYLLAPLMLMSTGKSLRRAGVALGLWVAGGHLLGWGLILLSNTTGLVRDAHFMPHVYHVVLYSPIGRMPDFLWGALCALVYLRYQRTLWNGSGRAALATALAAGSLFAIGALMFAMNQAGGITFMAGDRITAGWWYNYGIAAASGVLILALTHPNTPFARLLGKPLPVYLGQISYALYLLHMTPLVAWLQGTLNPAHLLFLPLFYALANVVSAAFYESVEQPARRLLLRLATAPPLARKPLETR